ncbi:hypothetical protein H7U32_01545 [Bifidobacterium pullorum subsp. saeculare]|uniref:Lipoprotein n=1 Tax=Bifidobacterium pullorum subsp. saeculare TaxID=78257 RepID=A0A938WW65_9BIFI|nr:hypothetical protein [Bifidobacterium pullorum]MBM6699031.1 hypothetical protein [Bifidobacterium pullorum subsp. saeculare]
MDMTTTTRTIAASLAALTTLAGLAGCSSTSSDERVLDKLDGIERRLDDLESRQGAGSGGAASPDDAGDNGATTSGGTAADLERAVADYEAKAKAAAATAGQAAVPSTPADRPKAYVEAKAPLETLSHQIDELDDRLEAAVMQGSIDRTTYFSLEQRLDQADDTLDQAEDRLEAAMGVDD